MLEKIEVREDLNLIVKNFGFKKILNKFANKVVFNVVLFNDEVIEFKNPDNLHKLFQSYKDIGETDFIKSQELVEEYKLDEDGEIVGTFISFKIVLKDGTIYRMFTSKFTDNRVIENYYKLFKLKQKADKKA